MSAIRFKVDPRDVPPVMAARRLGLTVEQFEAALPRLLGRGFPPSDPDTGNYDLDAIDAWRGARHRRLLQKPAPEDQYSGVVSARLERLGG